MTRVAGFEVRWTLEVSLRNGLVKFRTRNSWEENWGGGGFPQGPAIWYGEIIPVTAGHYRVTIDLETETAGAKPADDNDGLVADDPGVMTTGQLGKPTGESGRRRRSIQSSTSPATT